MNSYYDKQDFYKKMLELQEKLRKSEDERMKLEERFNLLSQDSRNRREACINKLRMRYIDFLEEQRLRDERNHQILGALDKIDGSLARMTARTDRLGILRKQYEAYLLRLYANRNASGATGDSGVGSHNDDISQKVTVSQTEKERPSMQRIVTQGGGNLPTFISQTNYPQSHIGASNISDFNIARHIPGQETIPQVHVMQTHGQGDGPTVMQPQHLTPQLFHGSQLNFQNTSGSKTQSTANLGHSGENYPPQFSQLNHNPLTSQSAQIHPRQFSDISDQYMADPNSRYPVNQSMIRLQNPLNNSQQNLGIIHSGLQPTIGLQSDKTIVKTLPDFSTDFNNQNLGSYRHSTPLPGYLDYSTRYSRDPSGNEPNLVARRSGFTRSDLENVIHRNEKILPRDYLHNPDILKPFTHNSKLSSFMEDKKKVLDTKPSKDMNSDELDEYINRIRSLHRDNDQSLEALDIEQNTSGDLLNATLSDDGLEPLPQPLPSDNKTQNNKIKIVPKDFRNVLELADNFLAETAADFSKDHQISTKSVFREKISEKDGTDEAELILNKQNDVSPVTLESDMTLDNLSISATRDDILSGTTSLDQNQTEDTSAISSDKFKAKVTLPIADLDTPRLDIKDITKVAQNNSVDPNEIPPNECDKNRVLRSSPVKYLKMKEKISDPDKQGIVVEAANPIQVTPIQPMEKDPDFLPQKTDVHEDIEGDKVSLIEEENSFDKVIDVVRELQPPSLQHYEKNVVEICVPDGDEKDNKTRKAIPQDSIGDENSEFKIEKTAGKIALDENNGAEIISSESSEANKVSAELDTPEKKYSSSEKIDDQMPNDSQENANEDLQCWDETEAKYKEDSNQGYSNDEHRSEQQLLQNPEENRDDDQEYDQIPEQSYNPDTIEHADYDLRQTGDESISFQQPYTTESNDPYNSKQIYDTNQQYEINPDQQYAYDGNEHTEGDPNEQYATGSNEQYTDDSNKQFAVDPNEKYAADQNEQYVDEHNEQYAVDPNNQYQAGTNEQYAVDSNGQYTADPNEQYATYPNEQYMADPNEQYMADPNEQYGYYQNDPNTTYDNSGNEYSGDQNYQQDPNQQYEHDPNQQYEHDPNQQYEHNPYQEYENDPNESYQQDPNQGYDKNQEYEENQNYEPVDYEEVNPPDVNQELKNEPNVQSSNENHPVAAAEEENEFAATPSDMHPQELLDLDETKVGEDSAELGKKKDKDVIKALLESDTESTIERNPSNNTESDFDFN